MNRTLEDALTPYANGEWGFTGTRAGLSFRQEIALATIVTAGAPLVIRHGGAHGGDTQFHGIVRKERKETFINVWPASADRLKYFVESKNIAIEAIRPPLVRNEEIVKRSAFLIACPHTQQEEQRSGTWHTIRCAHRLEKPVLVVWPNGLLTLDHLRQLTRVEIPR